MTDIDHVIEAIDHALNDYTTSGDAMRWNPEPRPEPGPAGGIRCWAPLGTLDGDEGADHTEHVHIPINPRGD